HSFGTAQDRENAMVAAVAAWNAALKQAGATVQLKLDTVAKTHFSAAQGQKSCTDAHTGDDVFRGDYTPTHTDNINAASTAMNNPQPQRGPGWVHGDSIESYKLDERLAETKLTPPPNAVGARNILEADILWFTHFRGGAVCSPIQWGFKAPGDPVFPRP